ncbi:hypothetical protein [Hydrogenibacillus schlegelii]|uniref:hypothetical protein n=1 Tax=Hydrogenibacillus schlegelii TaxID=1484 RepID=UPI0034A04440
MGGRRSGRPSACFGCGTLRRRSGWPGRSGPPEPPRAAAVYVRYVRRFGSPAVQGARPPVGRPPRGRRWAVVRWLARVRHPGWGTGTVLAARR